MKPDYIMNAKSEWGRNRIPRLQNLPPDEFVTPYCNEPETSKKRDPAGFRIRNEISPSAELETSGNANHTHDPESFSGQFRQRKRARTHREQDQSEQDLVDMPIIQGTQRPRNRLTKQRKQS